MLGVAVVCLLVAACSAAPSARSLAARPRLGGRIIGGQDADISQFPWQLSLQELGYHNCGASVISSTWALTAAHCLEGALLSSLSVRAGTSTRESGGTVYDVADAYYHANFATSDVDYDIGVVQISGSFSFGTNVQAVTLGTEEPTAGTAVNITGWGMQAAGSTSSPDQLQVVTTAIVARDSCSATYGERLTERMICAGEEEGGKDSCQGDSGGALVEGSTQYGIVSWGYDCAQPGLPGVYTNVANLRSWVTEVTGV